MIAVHPDKQRQGRGAALIGAVEQNVAERGGRIVLIETSGLGNFDGQRALYKRLGYAEEARIRDFTSKAMIRLCSGNRLLSSHARFR